MEKIKILGEEIECSDATLLLKVDFKYKVFELECIRYFGHIANSSKVEFLYDFWRGIGLFEWLFERHILKYITELLNDDGYENIDIDYYYQNYLVKYYTPLDVWHNGRILIKTAIEKITELFEINNDYESHHVVNELSKGEWDKKWFGLCTGVYHMNFNGKEIPDYIDETLNFLDELEYCDDILYCECSADQFLKAVDISRLKEAAMFAELDFIEETHGYKLAEYFPDKSTEITDKLKNIKTADEEAKKQIMEAIKLCPLNEDAYKLIIRLFGDKDGEVDAAARQLELKDLYESRSDENHPQRGEFTYKEGLLYEILEKSNVNTYQELQEIEQEVNEKSKFYGVNIPSKITSVLQEARAILEKQAEQERIKQEEERKQREREEQERIRREAEQKRLAEEAEKRKQEEAARLAEENERKRLEAERIRKEQEEQERLEREEQKKIKEQKAQERALIEEEKKRKSEALPITNKSKIAALILSILFGWLGIDRFYLGHIVTGIIKLITGGGFGVWWLIDVILIVSDILTPKDGRYMTRKGLG